MSIAWIMVDSKLAILDEAWRGTRRFERSGLEEEMPRRHLRVAAGWLLQKVDQHTKPSTTQTVTSFGSSVRGRTYDKRQVILRSFEYDQHINTVST